MKRIFPKQYPTVFYRQGNVVITPSISELGVYGAYIGHGDRQQAPILNEYSGYLLRTKGSSVDEGGVATGYSVLNSITLMEP
jgi:glutathione synthase